VAKDRPGPKDALRSFTIVAKIAIKSLSFSPDFFSTVANNEEHLRCYAATHPDAYLAALPRLEDSVWILICAQPLIYLCTPRFQ
jgi:hypothetical protein